MGRVIGRRAIVVDTVLHGKVMFHGNLMIAAHIMRPPKAQEGQHELTQHDDTADDGTDDEDRLHGTMPFRTELVLCVIPPLLSP